MKTMTSLLVSCFFLLIISQEIVACSCPHFIPGPARVRKEAFYAKVIFVGKVIDSSSQTRTFKILQHIKGLEGIDTIVSGNFTSCSTLYEPGYYIIYGSLEGDQLNTSYCSNNEQLILDDYRDVGAYDINLFEKLLANGIEQHSFHISYLKKLFEPQAHKALLFTATKHSDWYRNHTVYSSLKLGGIGLIIITLLLYLIRAKNISLNFKRNIIWLLILATAANVLSVLVYGELKPIGFGTNQLFQLHGFPRYIYSISINTSSNSYVNSYVHYVNFLVNFFVYFILFGTVLLTYKYSKGIAKKSTE